MRHRHCLMCLYLFVAPVAHAADPEPLTLKRVVANVLENSPQLSINDFESRAAAARLRRSELTKPLEMQLEFENFAGTGDVSGVDQLESTLSLVKILEPGDAVTARRGLAEGQASLIRSEQDVRRLDLLANATQGFIHVVADQHRLDIAHQQFRLAERTHRVVSDRVAAGRSHTAEARRSAIELSRAELSREHAEHELAASRVRLSVLWGETRPIFDRAAAAVFSLPSLPSFERLETLLANNPDLLRLTTEASLAQARVRLAESRGKPDLKLSAGVRYYSEPDEAALVFLAGIPLGARAQVRPEIDELQALAEQEPLRQKQKQLALYSRLYETYQEIRHAKTAFETLSKDIIPQAEQAAADYEAGYQRGRFSLLELNQSQQDLLNARLERLDAAENYHRLRIELERITGTDLTPGESL